MPIQNSKQKKGIDLMAVLAFLMVARFSCAALSNIPIFSMTFIFVYGTAFFGLFLMSAKSVSKREGILLSTVLAYALFVLMQTILSGKGIFFTDAFNAYMMVFMITVYLWAKRQPRSLQAGLITVIFIGLLVSYLYSVYVLYQDSDASRIAATGEKSQYDILNAAGGFGAVYGGVLTICILLFSGRVLKAQKGKKKVFVWVLLAFAIAFILMASYATALLLLLLVVALFFTSKSKVLSGVLVLGTIIVLLLHEQVGDWIMDLSGRLSVSRMLRDKLYDMGEMLQTFEVTGTYAGEGGRLDRILRSWNTFLKYPILGGYSASDGRFGNHCELFDILGKFGVLGIGLLITFFVSLYKDIYSGIQNSEIKKCCSIIFLIYAITTVMNPALFSGQLLPMMLTMPLITAYIGEKENADNIGEERN